MARFLPHPGSLPNDLIVALRDPDRFAWHMFRAPTWLADLDARTAAPKQATLLGEIAEDRRLNCRPHPICAGATNL